MTPLSFVLVILFAIVLLTFMTLKLKINPVMVLFITAVIIGLLTGHSLPETTALVKQYFGSTLGGIGVLIIFGAIIAEGIKDTGAATTIVNFFIRLFKGKNLELAPTLTGFVMSIPVFGDIAIVLNAPISAIISKRRKLSMTVIAPFVNLGLTLTHGLVPPTPGILAVSLILGADLGQVIFWGLILSVLSMMVNYIALKPWLSRSEYIEPLPEFIEGIEEAESDSSVDDLLIEDENLPGAFVSFLPLILPIIMITIGSFAEVLFDEGTTAYLISQTIGDSVLAMFVGIVTLIIIGLKRKETVRRRALIGEPEDDQNMTYWQVVANKWVSKALLVAIVPLIVTAMGGAMGGILRENSAIVEIGNIVAATNFPKILIPFLLSALLMAVVGSMTTAVLTAAGLVLPMLPVLGIDPVVASLAIGAGSMVFWHVNNSGFWIFTSLYNFNTKQGLKYFTTVNAAGGIVAFAFLALFHLIGLL